MTDTLRPLFQAQLTGSDASLFLGTAGHSYAFGPIYVCNASDGDVKVTIFVRFTAGSGTDANAILSEYYLTGRQTIPPDFFRGIVLIGAGEIRGLCDVAAVVTVSGFGIDTTA